MADLVWVKWYATVLRQNSFAAEVARVAPIALRYGATRYAVHVDNDDRYRITQMTWIPSKSDWYRYWDGPEMIEFRAAHWSHFQIPIQYAWADEIADGALGPQVANGQHAPNGINGEPSTPAPVTPSAA